MKKRPFIKAGLQISNRGKADIPVENIYFLLPRILRKERPSFFRVLHTITRFLFFGILIYSWLDSLLGSGPFILWRLKISNWSFFSLKPWCVSEAIEDIALRSREILRNFAGMVEIKNLSPTNQTSVKFRDSRSSIFVVFNKPLLDFAPLRILRGSFRWWWRILVNCSLTSPNAELSLGPVFLNFEIRETEGKNEFEICKICRDSALGLRSKLL